MSYELTLTITRVKEEHVAYTVALLVALSDVFGLDGQDIGTDIGVERDRDGVERFAEFIHEVEA